MPVYYPYFRGRQNELLVIRERASLLAAAQFSPIIEPVKSSLNGLKRALDALDEAGAEGFLVLNPRIGDHSSDPESIERCLQDFPKIGVAVLALADSDQKNLVEKCARYKGSDRSVMTIHAGYTDGKGLANRMGTLVKECVHVFSEEDCGKRYRSHFSKDATRVLLADGFKKKINREYADNPVEEFSELHLVYEEEGMNGFGDYLIAGSEYSESGGPAYAVAIHLTFIDPKRDDVMFVHHFVSDTVHTPTDPAGKFGEAVRKLAAEVNRPGMRILRTKAVEEFLDLEKRDHFPGLGYVKKLSMIHHIETLEHFFKGAGH